MVWLLVALVAFFFGLLVFWPDSGQSVRAAEVIDTAVLRSLDDRTHLTLSSFRYNRATQTYLGTVTVSNTSTEPLAAPLYLVVAAVSLARKAKDLPRNARFEISGPAALSLSFHGGENL